MLQPTIPNILIIFQEAKKNLSITERDQELQQLIKKSDILYSQRQPQNLTKYYQELNLIQHQKNMLFQKAEIQGAERVPI